MKRRRIKLVWGASKVIRGRWYFGLFGLYDREEGQREDGFAISVRGLMLWSLAGVLSAYVAGAAALWSFWQRNPYCLLTYGDAFFYPVRRAEVAAKKGQAFIAEGQVLMKDQKWSDGAQLLRHGLTLYPGDLSARLALARFYTLTNQRALAVKLLSEELPGDSPGRIYLQGLFSLAEQSEDQDLIVTMVDRFLPLLKGERAAVERRWLGARKFVALLAGQRAAEALAFSELEDPGDMAAEHRVLALLDLGRASEAADFLETWQKRPGADLRAVQRLQVRVFRDAKRVDDMERALEELRALSPDDPRQAVYGVVQRALAGREAAAGAALDDFLFRFGGSAGNLQMAAEPLAEIGNRTLFERCAAAARERGYAPQPFRVLQVQLHVQRGEWAEAAAVLAQMKPTPGRPVPANEQIWSEWMGRLVDAALSPAEVPQAAVLEFLRGRPWPMKIFRTYIEGLRRAGRIETAREVIAIAEGTFPASRWVLTQKAEVAKEFAALPVAAPPVVLTGAAGPVKERVFFEELDARVRERKWAEAGGLIRDVRAGRPPPVWLEKRDGDTRLAEVRINQGLGETPAMLAAAGLYLNGDAERARRVIEVAREFFGAGDKLRAIALVEAVVQRTPEHAQARKLLAEWKPRPQPVEPKK